MQTLADDITLPLVDAGRCELLCRTFGGLLQDMHREIHEVAGLQRRAAVQSYALLAAAAFDRLPMALLAPTDNLRPDAPLIAEALRRLDVDCVAAGMEALEALHSAAAAAVDAAAAAAAAPLLATLRRHVRVAAAALERERVQHSSKVDSELVAELDERALQRQSLSVRHVLRRNRVDASDIANAVGAVAESAQAGSTDVAPANDSGSDDASYSDDYCATELPDRQVAESAETVALETLIADCSTVVEHTESIEAELRTVRSGLDQREHGMPQTMSEAMPMPLWPLPEEPVPPPVAADTQAAQVGGAPAEDVSAPGSTGMADAAEVLQQQASGIVLGNSGGEASRLEWPPHSELPRTTLQPLHGQV